MMSGGRNWAPATGGSMGPSRQNGNTKSRFDFRVTFRRNRGVIARLRTDLGSSNPDLHAPRRRADRGGTVRETSQPHHDRRSGVGQDYAVGDSPGIGVSSERQPRRRQFRRRFALTGTLTKALLQLRRGGAIVAEHSKATRKAVSKKPRFGSPCECVRVRVHSVSGPACIEERLTIRALHAPTARRITNAGEGQRLRISPDAKSHCAAHDTEDDQRCGGGSEGSSDKRSGVGSE